MVGEHNDDTLDELRQRGGFDCSLTTIWRALRRRGLTRKKKSMHADDRDRPDVKRKRRSFRKKVEEIEPRRLIFIDESGVSTAMTRTHAWAARERAVGSAPGKWESYTVVAAIGPGRRACPAGVSGVDRRRGLRVLRRGCAGAGAAPGDVVIWDRLPSHQGYASAAVVRRAGAKLIFLPPYSNDYTPIERLWSKVKTYLRRVAARSKDTVYRALGEALESVTAQDIVGWFQHAGLCAMHQ